MPLKDWRASAAYLHIPQLDPAALAWEYLRRNPDYRRDWQQFRQGAPANKLLDWGCAFLDPAVDSRLAKPHWTFGSSRLRLIESDELSDEVTFSLWRIPGIKTLQAEGDQVLLTASVDQHALQLTLSAGIAEGRPFAFCIPASIHSNVTCKMMSRIVALLAPRGGPPRPRARDRPNREAVLHMRALQALDAEDAGASHREMAHAIFGANDTWQRWERNSELRAQIRYLLRRGHALMNGGYRHLLTPSQSKKGGETHTALDSP